MPLIPLSVSRITNIVLEMLSLDIFILDHLKYIYSDIVFTQLTKKLN